MPPRRKNSSRGVYGSLSDPYESLEPRAKRLRGDSIPPAEATAPQTSRPPTSVAIVPANRNLPPPAATRSDVPHVRNLRRGSASVAMSGLEQFGLPQLVDELVEDKHAKTSRGSQTSYRATWTKFHRSIFGDESSTIPLSVDYIVAVAALFKKGRLPRIRKLHLSDEVIPHRSESPVVRPLESHGHMGDQECRERDRAGTTKLQLRFPQARAPGQSREPTGDRRSSAADAPRPPGLSLSPTRD